MRAFSSNSLVNTIELTAAVRYILTAKVPGLVGILLCENEQAQTKWIIVSSEENTCLDAYGS